jgi:large subunit ribosomal protein L18
VFRSNRHIYAQLIDDDSGRTVAQASSREDGFKKKQLSVETAGEVGKLVAARGADAGVQQVVFDRGGFPFHGRVKALADAARKEGLEF